MTARGFPLTARALAGAFILATGCSGSNSVTSSNNGGTDRLTAMVDNSAFTSDLAVNATYSGSILSVGGAQNTGGSNSRKISLYVYNVGGTGTYSLGSQPLNFATYIELTGEVTHSWSSSFSGATGSITVTQLTATHVTGTFTFTAPAVTSTGSSGLKTITNGSFSATLQ